MTEPGDPVSRRYRDLAREEPPGALDAAILARARTSVGARPRSTTRWMGPVSIAAVLVLGIGVTLRMQLEQPGIETALPSPAQSEYSAPATPPAPEPAPEAPRDAAASARQAPAKEALAAQGNIKEDRMAIAAPKPQEKRRDAPASAGAGARSETQATVQGEPNPFAEGPVVMQQAPSGASTPATTFGTAPPLEEKSRAKLSADLARAPAPAAAADSVAPAAAPAAPAASVGSVAVAPAPAAAAPAPAAVVTAPVAAAPARVSPAPAPAPAPPPPTVAAQGAPQASAAAPSPAMPAARPASPALGRVATPQPKQEAFEANTAERELKKSIVAAEPDPDPARELERIAKLRQAGAQREADRALEAFRRRHPDFRISEAMWERVKPR